ncbi:hypothetical protein OQA88_12797 [Cercophora sp. LCS_1]
MPEPQEACQGEASPFEKKQEQAPETKAIATQDATENETESKQLAKRHRRASTYNDAAFAGLEEVHQMLDRLAESRAKQLKEQEGQRGVKSQQS